MFEKLIMVIIKIELTIWSQFRFRQVRFIIHFRKM